ncbi:hypothetical protein [Holdemania massiliensis]|uniref:hypothetical protein n=1 Tax=Holdemania massiliensis TaxID=1468449 RepID=UPI001F051339|nr:hypothetical protein [Holdemania massiliensis]MCH1940000.1 hypothetical protein [Holdemania massiliensis]
MLKEELESLIGQPVTGDQYNLINHVYMWHPADLEKQDVANLWGIGKLEIFKELEPAADKACEIKMKIGELKRLIGVAESDYDSFKARYMNNAQD